MYNNESGCAGMAGARVVWSREGIHIRKPGLLFGLLAWGRTLVYGRSWPDPAGRQALR